MDFRLLSATKLTNTPDVTGRTWHQAVERDTATDYITIDTAGEIDAAWVNNGMPADGLRIYGLRRSGNKTMTFLGVPGTNGHNPAYVLSNGRYLHLSGPTLADFQRQREYAQASQDARDLYAWATGR